MTPAELRAHADAAEGLRDAVARLSVNSKRHGTMLAGLGQRFAEIRSAEDIEGRAARNPAPGLAILMAEILRIVSEHHKQAATDVADLIGASRACLDCALRAGKD